MNIMVIKKDRSPINVPKVIQKNITTRLKSIMKLIAMNSRCCTLFCSVGTKCIRPYKRQMNDTAVMGIRKFLLVKGVIGKFR